MSIKKNRTSSISQRRRRRLKFLRQLSIRLLNGKLVISSVPTSSKPKKAGAGPVKPTRPASPALVRPIVLTEEDARLVALNGPGASGRRPFVGYDREQAAYARMKPELLTRAEGKFVVLVGDDLQGPVETFGEALRLGYRQFGLGPLYVKQVLAEEPVAETSRDI